jgi:hypothetical protein
MRNRPRPIIETYTVPPVGTVGYFPAIGRWYVNVGPDGCRRGRSLWRILPATVKTEDEARVAAANPGQA